MPRTTEEILKDAEKSTRKSQTVSLSLKTISRLKQLVAELSTKLREREWQDIANIINEDEGRVCLFGTNKDLSYMGMWFKLGVCLSNDLELMDGEHITSYFIIPTKKERVNA